MALVEAEGEDDESEGVAEVVEDETEEAVALVETSELEPMDDDMGGTSEDADADEDANEEVVSEVVAKASALEVDTRALVADTSPLAMAAAMEETALKTERLAASTLAAGVLTADVIDASANGDTGGNEASAGVVVVNAPTMEPWASGSTACGASA